MVLLASGHDGASAEIAHFVNWLGMNLNGDIGPLTIFRAKRGRHVAFEKSIIEVPATRAQLVQRKFFTRAAVSWANLSIEEKNLIKQAAIIADLRITGYNLWLSVLATQDLSIWKTIEAQAGFALPTPTMCV